MCVNGLHNNVLLLYAMVVVDPWQLATSN